MRLMLAMGLAGALGAISRYLAGGWVARMLPAAFPFGTLLVNVTGSLFLGIVFELGTSRAMINPELRTALGVGFLGAFTTFSTFSLETVNLLREGSYLLAGTNVMSNMALCLFAAWLGIVLVRLAA